MKRTLMILGVLILSFCAFSVALPRAAAADDCGTTREDSLPVKAELTLAFLNGSEFIGPTPQIDLDESRGERSLLLEYRAAGCTFPSATIGQPISIQTFVPRSADGVQMNASVEARGQIKSPSLVAITFTLFPSSDTIPGTYNTGFVVADNDEIAFTRQSIVATASYQWQLAVFAGLMVPIALIGTLIIWIKTIAVGVSLSYGAWLKNPGNIGAILSGIAAVWTVFATNVLEVKDYGRYLELNSIALWVLQSDFWKLMIATLAAFMVAAIPVSIAGDKITKKQQDKQ